jgi:tetratricopeptide (TPR) repeat protein
MLKRLLLLVVMQVFSLAVFSQEISWPSPEVAQMYRQAKEYLSKGAIQQAVTLFRQAIQLAPDVPLLYRDLGQALLLAREYNDAYKAVEPMLKNGKPEEQVYQVAGAALLGKGDKKKARKMLEKGLEDYPYSGMLYNEMAKYHESEEEMADALANWLRGIEKDPAYHLNYYNAARIYSLTEEPVWTIIYGEIFVNMERETARSLEVRKMMMQAYRKLFASLGSKTAKDLSMVRDFETAYLQTMLQVSPVVSDGINTDNLTMLRARFTMDWMKDWQSKYPLSLFHYHNRMLSDGVFEAYNQWLFGKAESPAEFESWTKFHLEAVPDYLDWLKTNAYKPTSSDFYNRENVKALFPKKKKG